MPKALIIVDPQNDFCQGGPLGVKDSQLIFPVINQLKSSDKFSQIVITKDWHPENHISFAKNHNKQPFQVIELQMNGEKVKQVLWPNHCVQNTKGAQFSQDLNLSQKDQVVLKGFRDFQEVYSGFGTETNHTQLKMLFNVRKINQVYVTGLALDYCVGLTALDSQKAGFKTYVIEQGTKGISQQTIEQMMNKFKAAGVQMISKDKVLAN